MTTNELLALVAFGLPVWIAAGIAGNWARRRWNGMHLPYKDRLP